MTDNNNGVSRVAPLEVEGGDDPNSARERQGTENQENEIAALSPVK